MGHGPPFFFALWGIPFVFIGLYLVVGRFVVRAVASRRARYVITDRRVLIAGGLSGTRTTSVYLRSLPPPVMAERPDRSGSLAFGAFPAADRTRRWRDGSAVERMIWQTAPMQMADFWQLVDEARRDVGVSNTLGSDIAAILGARLTASTPDEILDFDRCFRRAHSRAFQWNLWAAAERMWGFCSDDTFSGFRAGLIGLGHDAFERIVTDPDALADHPLIQRIARGEVESEVLYMEPLEHVAAQAYARVTGDDDSFWDVVQQRDAQDADDERSPGERFDLGDAAEVRRRLPKLSALFPSDSLEIR